MLLPYFAVDALLQEKRPEHRTYETTWAGVYDPGQTPAQSNTLSHSVDVENKPCLEWGQMAADVKLPPVPSSEPDTANPIDSGNDLNKVMDSPLSAALESMDIQKTIISRRKGEELFLARTPVLKREQSCMKTPSQRNSNPFFDDPNYEWGGEEDTPALIEYIEHRFNVMIHNLTLTRTTGPNQNPDKPNMNINNTLTPGSKQSQFGHESYNLGDGETPQTPIMPQKQHNDVQASPNITPLKRSRGRHSFPLRRPIPGSPSLQSPNATPSTLQSGPDLPDTLFSPTEFEGKQGFICTYKCPLSGETCRVFSNGNNKRNRYRHIAIHAQAEEELVVSGVIALEDALAFTKLQKVVVKCDIKGCDFETKVWRTDQVRERHELEVHLEEYMQRVRERMSAKSGDCD